MVTIQIKLNGKMQYVVIIQKGSVTKQFVFDDLKVYNLGAILESF